MPRQVARVYARTKVAAFPMAFQCTGQSDREPDYLVVSPGRMVDAANSINFDVGIRIFVGLLAKLPEWNIAGYAERSEPPIWTMLGDSASVIPWGGQPMQLLLEFYRSTTATGPACNVEFAIVAYNEALEGGRDDRRIATRSKGLSGPF